MRNMILWAAASLALVGAAPGASLAQSVAQSPSWRAYPYPDLGFSVDLPAEPQRQDQPARTDRGQIPTSFVGVQYGARAYGVISGDYSTASGGVPSDPAAAVNAAMGWITKSRTIVSQSNFDVPGGAGREAIARDGKSVSRFRVYFRGARVYIVSAVTTDTLHPEMLQDAVSARVFASFTPLSR